MEEKAHDIWNPRFTKKIINSMTDGVFTMDSEGRVSSWNPSMERISGYSAQEAMGKSCDILQCTRCFGKECPAGIQQCGILEQGATESKECMLVHKDGSNVPVIKNADVVRDEGNVIIGVVETITDLTELNKARQKAEAAALKLQEQYQMGNIIGKSHEMRKVFTAINAAAASDATILIQGDSGTGKELVADAIHYNSARKSNPLITVNCSALSESLLESELFGHVRGAYTGAVGDRTGRFEEARGGTIFLDEIGELSPYIQVKLLRVLQEREIERVGESKKRKIDIRIITATHQDLYQQVNEGRFREDLYYRLKVFPIHLPSLYERRDDIPLLVEHFIRILNKKTGKHIQNLSRASMRIFMDYDWRGNVRELENAIEHAFVLCNQKEITPDDLPIEICQSNSSTRSLKTPSGPRSKPRTHLKMSKERLLRLLKECEWNKVEVGRQVGVSHTAIWKYMKKWDIPLKKPF